jgi:hypothetical protein
MMCVLTISLSSLYREIRILYLLDIFLLFYRFIVILLSFLRLKVYLLVITNLRNSNSTKTWPEITVKMDIYAEIGHILDLFYYILITL